MNSFSNPSSLFDLSQASSFSQLPDDDFLALLQKQFPGQSQNNQLFSGFTNVNPQNLSQFNLQTISPSSENTSPSPPNLNANDNKKQGAEEAEEPYESALKRKASDDDFDDEPSQKNQHTEDSSSATGKKGTATKRKASGSNHDESKALKRKEQNRAAQRAFRERKEKHVRDLEDKVSASEAKNEALATENENLRDLLTQLQSENMTLRQQASSSSFTFTVPKSATVSTPAKSPQFLTDNSLFSTLPRTMYTSPDPNHFNNPVDMTSLMSFDPSVLNLLDETPQQTATDGAMQLDFGFSNHNTDKVSTNSNNNNWLPSNLTTLSTNPAYFSLANMFESPSPPSASSSTAPVSATNNEHSAFNFDLNSLQSWPATDVGTLDDLFGGYINPPPPMDVDTLLRNSPSSFSQSSASPVVHHNKPSPSSSASSSPASHTSEPSIFSTREGSSSDSELGHDESQCPKTRAEVIQTIAAEGSSPFVKDSQHGKCQEAVKAQGPSMFVDSEFEHNVMGSITCQPGTTTFPKTEQNDNNIEVLAAWRSIRADPNFKMQDCDMTKLCTEFASKARCDGSKVVLEPAEVQHIRESLSRKH